LSAAIFEELTNTQKYKYDGNFAFTGLLVETPSNFLQFLEVPPMTSTGEKIRSNKLKKKQSKFVFFYLYSETKMQGGIAVRNFSTISAIFHNFGGLSQFLTMGIFDTAIFGRGLNHDMWF
jgi:hypothetical protein